MMGSVSLSYYWCKHAVLPDGSVASNVLISTESEWIMAVQSDVLVPPEESILLDGLVMPGFANVHSHVFHRALRGNDPSKIIGFQPWLIILKDLTDRLNPDNLYLLARATFSEMVLAGITAVGEFHYVHHAERGVKYSDPNAMSMALMAAAEYSGIRMTLLDTIWLQDVDGGSPLSGTQLRYSDGSVDGWISRIELLKSTGRVKHGAAMHALTVVPRNQWSLICDYVTTLNMPLHYHLAGETDRVKSVELYHTSAARALDDAGLVGESTTAVHATYVDKADCALIGNRGAYVCFCCTSKRDLASPVGPILDFSKHQANLCVGSDGHSSIDMFEEIRALEWEASRESKQRGNILPRDLIKISSESGMKSLGWRAGRLEQGYLADFIHVDLRSTRMAGSKTKNMVDHLVYAATASDVKDVVIGGKFVVREWRHLNSTSPSVDLGEAIDSIYAEGVL